MPRKKDDNFESLPAMVAYREELDEIIQTIQRVCGKVTLVSDKMEFESLAELQEHMGDKLSELEIEGSGSSPYKSLKVQFGTSSVYLSRSGGTEEVNAAWYYLRDLISRKNRGNSFFHTIFYSKETLWAFSQISMMMLLIVLSNLRIIVPIWLWVIAAMVFVFFSISMFFSPKRVSVYLKRKREVTTFWNRNRDEILKLVIAAIIGAALTLAIQLLISNLAAR